MGSSAGAVGGGVLAAMILSWFANPLIPINPRMMAAIAVQVYLAAFGVFVASAAPLKSETRGPPR